MPLTDAIHYLVLFETAVVPLDLFLNPETNSGSIDETRTVLGSPVVLKTTPMRSCFIPSSGASGVNAPAASEIHEQIVIPIIRRKLNILIGKSLLRIAITAHK